jgi:hypothetical protein
MTLLAGAKELGVAAGKEIQLQVADNERVTLTSETAFLPHGVRAKVFGLYRPEQKTHKFSEGHIFGSNTEAEFSEKVRKW